MPRVRRIEPDQMILDEDETTEEETPPSPRRRRSSAAPEAAPSGAKQFEDDEDEEGDEGPAPAAVRRRRASSEKEAPVARTRHRSQDGDEETDDDASVIPISRGRKEIKKNRPATDSGLAFFRWEEEPQLIKFIEDDPWSYDQHWVTREGKQSFPCLGKGCPLCAIGVKATQKIVYTVLNLTPPKGDEYIVQTLEVGLQLEGTLAKLHDSPKTGPLSRLWWSVSRSDVSSGSRKKYNYIVTPVKDRDLEDDWSIDLDEAEDAADAAKAPDPSDVLGKWNRAQLQEIADEAMGHS